MNTNKNKNKLANVVNESNVKLLNILSRLCADLFVKRITRDLFNKYLIYEKVIFTAVKILKLFESKKCMERNNLCTWSGY